jgi:hypothetical protein
MNRKFWTTAVAVTSFVAISTPAIISASHFSTQPAFAQGAMEMSQDIVAAITQVKGKPESAALMRKHFKDLSPIGIQPGGAGMVVNLYSKKEDITLSLCTTFDVVVAVQRGRIAKFPAAAVK